MERTRAFRETNVSTPPSIVGGCGGPPTQSRGSHDMALNASRRRSASLLPPSAGCCAAVGGAEGAGGIRAEAGGDALLHLTGQGGGPLGSAQIRKDGARRTCGINPSLAASHRNACTTKLLIESPTKMIVFPTRKSRITSPARFMSGVTVW